MKRIPLLIVMIFASALLVSLSFSAPVEKQLWTCGMHPQIIKDEPGNCPICGMKLTPVRGNGATVPTGAADAAAIHIDPATVQRMNLKTAVISAGPVQHEIRTYGSVAFDEAGIRDITTKYEGWIEKLFVNTTWTSIRAGDPLFEIYSPDLYNAELNYLVARGSEGETNGPLSRAALGRLQLFDVPKEFITQLNETGKAQRNFVYRAPADGMVIEKNAVVGQMMKAGERIYRTADLAHVWVLAQVYEQDLPYVTAGQTATVRISYGPERTYQGTVALVLPQIEEQTRAATARIVLPNTDGALRPGMYVDVRFEPRIADAAVLVPEMAILRTGDRNTVFIAKDGGTFEARDITLGVRSSTGDYEVLSGLRAGERVVTSGQFMLDSESQLREAIEKMSGGATTIPGAATSATGTHAAAASPAPKATPELIALANTAADAAAALAKDDLAAYNREREAANRALSAWLVREAGGTPALPSQPLPLAVDLKSARETFEPFSTAITDFVRAVRVDRNVGLHAFECPMPPSGSGKGRWLQRTVGTKNPFYGSAMPDCGSELPQK